MKAKRLLKIITSISLVSLMLVMLVSCSNQFAHKKNAWKFMISTDGTNPQKFYLDENRSVCEKGICKAWTKMVFFTAEVISFPGRKRPIKYITKRIDSEVIYDCLRKTSTVSSYQLYNSDDKFIYSNWPNNPISEHVERGSVDEVFFKFLCR